LERTEALTVLHEIFDVCKESVIMNCVSLDSHVTHRVEESGSFEIRIKCCLDRQSKDCIKPILERHQLDLREEKEFVILFSKN
jgi:hypothetical protein